MKILLLVIYSDDDPFYQEMLRIQRLQVLPSNIERYFVQFRKNQIEEIVLENDFVFVRGNESRLNILRKTIAAFSYFVNNDYDFIVRSNISTIIEPNNLQNWLHSLPFRSNIYCSGHVLKLEWIDHTSGIYDKSLFGTWYGSGTSIILSADVVKNIVLKQHNLRYDIIDDVSLGDFVHRFLNPECLQNLLTYIVPFSFTPNPKAVFMRNRTICDRSRDLENMQRCLNI
jgi:hypothetical protein